MRTISLLLCALVLAPAPAWAEFCSDKANGWWCDGDNLVICQNGSQTSSEKCSCGCQSMPPGTPDQCAACGGFCGDKANGWWCDGDNLVICQNGSQTSSEKCSCGCQSMPAGTPDQCGECSFCDGKADGNWCDGDWLVHCSGGDEANSAHCPDGCNGSDGSAKCEEAQPLGFCADKADGLWCDGADLVTCGGGQQSASTSCEFGCKSMPPGTPDQCDEEEVIPTGFCNGKTDGFWCNGELLTLCSGGQQSSSVACANGCQTMPEGTDDQCVAASPETPDGTLLTVTKSGGCGLFAGNIDLWSTTGLERWNQKDWPSDTLGTCQGLTIKSSGCTVSALAMLYAFIGTPRTVDGKSGNKPPLEDAWRSVIETGHARGYAGTDYSINGISKHGECLARWDKNPSGIALQYHYNVSAGCVEYGAAVAIANSLNSGLPVVAGVHWQSGKEDQHWVLVVGSRNGELLFNDPWGGTEVEGLANGELGSYTIDTFFTPYLDGGMGGPGGEALFDEDGLPVTDERATSRLPEVLEDALPADNNVVIPADDLEESAGEDGGGCGMTGQGSRPALMWLLLLVAVIWRRRSRCA